ncbi:phosphatidylcholine translocator ABCB4-like isoform X2 [Hyposmocoma kahamanoa]|nr:phosphatidylcholine translocator ABCB4-like isoform X2 [Hyposmocoma kahamanoa]
MITVAMLATIFAALSLPFAITIVANAFQSMIDYDKSITYGTNNAEEFMNNMHWFGMKYSCIGVILFAGGYVGTAFMNIAAINQVFKIREAYMRAAMNQDFTYYDEHSTGDLASKMTSDLIKLEDGIGDKLTATVYNLAIALGCIVMSLLKGWKLALLCLLTAPISFLLVGVTGALAHHLSKRAAVQTGLASAIAEEVLSSIRTVFAFNGQNTEVKRYSKPLAKARKIEIKKEFFTGLSMGFLFFCIFCSYALSFYFGIYLIINEPENYNADVMFSVFFGVMTGLGNLGMVGSLFTAFGSARGAGASIFQLIDNLPVINPLLERGIRPKQIYGNVELRNVWFDYPCRRTVPVLCGLSIEIRRGQSVALVGPSGCGKSTVISLISRYYDVTDGSVLIDGTDVRSLSVQWLRAQIGIVGQEPVLFNTSVLENIRYGREDATDAEITAAAKQANAHDFIMYLPKGYATLVGESGASLSGGQKQRIAIARALIRNPAILMLDEATSALDTTSEAKVQLALDQASQGRTTLIVAHRLSTIRRVDTIYVMNEGQVVERGSHMELVAKKGMYYNMLILQDPLAVAERDQNATVSREDLVSVTGTVLSTASTNSYKSFMSKEEVKGMAIGLSFWSVIKLNAPEWKSITVGCVCATAIGLAMPLFVLVFGDLFGSMADTQPEKLMLKVSHVSTVCIIIGIIMGLSHLIETLSFGIAGSYLTQRLRLRMFEHLLQQDVSYFDDRANSTGALCARLSGEASHVQGATGSRVGVILQGAASICLALTLAMLYEYRVGLVSLCFFPFVAIVVYFESQAVTQESFGNAKTLENSTKIAVETMLNIRTVVSLGREKQVLKEYTAQLRPALRPAKRTAHFRAVVAGLSRSIFNFINAAALTYGSHLIVSEGLPYKNIIITTQSLQIASSQGQNAFAYAPEIQKGINAASRAVALLNTRPKLKDPEVPAADPFVSDGQASFNDVIFKYPTRSNVKVLRRMDLEIESGKTIALVGESGCGKSTVIKLLQRFYDPDDGTVALDGTPIPQLRINEVRASFGLVAQEPVLFDRTIAENIAYGDNSRTPSQREIEDAAKRANIHNFIVGLPLGYDSNIGTKGVQLSGGQKQRVAIARALVRCPKILLLDEATSALDTESEKLVQAALDQAKVGRTCVTIAHRLSTVRDSDVICVLEHGRVAETGTHDQLMKIKKLYYHLHKRISS